MNATIEKLDSEIARLQAEAAKVEAMPATIAERYAVAETALRDAERVYRVHGLYVSAGHPLEDAHLKRQAEIGALMVIAPDKLLAVERQRIEQQGEGLSAADKARKLAELRRAIDGTEATRELALLKIVGEDNYLVPRLVHPLFAVLERAELERIAAAR